MNKKILTYILYFISIKVLAMNQIAFAENKCTKLEEEISVLEKELSNKTKLLAIRKQELEKLPSESTSIKMKLTADTFIIAAESETTQNWIESKRIEKKKNCGSSKKRTLDQKSFQSN